LTIVLTNGQSTTTEDPSQTRAEASTSTEADALTQEEQEYLHNLQQQQGPFIDLLGLQVYSLERNDTHAELLVEATNSAVSGADVIGFYFSADWCGPCRKFTPELVAFHERMLKKKKKFKIVFISSCRDPDSLVNYYAGMGKGWLALPYEESVGERGNWLKQKYNVKGIPTLVLLDGDSASTINKNGVQKVREDKSGVGFPWRHPLSFAIRLVPKTLRKLIKRQAYALKKKLVDIIKIPLAGLRR